LLSPLSVDAQIEQNKNTTIQMLTQKDKMSIDVDTVIDFDDAYILYTSSDTADTLLKIDFEQQFLDSLSHYVIDQDSLVHSLNLRDYGKFTLDLSDHKNRKFVMIDTA